MPKAPPTERGSQPVQNIENQTARRAAETALSAVRSSVSSPCSASAEQGQGPVGAVLVLEREQHHALPLAEAEPPVGERHLFGARAEQRIHEPFARGSVTRHDPFEQ